jgi:hypothetical protein
MNPTRGNNSPKWNSTLDLGLESLQAGGQRRLTIPPVTGPQTGNLLGTDQPKRRILREPLGVVHILIARDAAVDGLAQQVSERKLSILSST